MIETREQALWRVREHNRARSRSAAYARTKRQDAMATAIAARKPITPDHLPTTHKRAMQQAGYRLITGDDVPPGDYPRGRVRLTVNGAVVASWARQRDGHWACGGAIWVPGEAELNWDNN